VLVVTQVVSRSGDELKIEVTLQLNGSLMEMEAAIAGSDQRRRALRNRRGAGAL
jgi:hypothetical protein